jgi:hypothetical protein
MAKKKTWAEKLHCGKTPHVKEIDKAFADIPAGAQMYISSPEEINEFVKGIAKGQFITPKEMRAALAKAGGAEHTCPVSTGIFLRIASEAAYEEHLQGKDLSEITPFWRVVEPDSDLAKKLECGTEFIRLARDSELAA